MTIEEKANAYNKVLKKVKDLISRCKNDTDRRTMIYRVEDIESILSELAESENEKIRKAIISGMTALKDQGKETFASIPINDCIAWLEKQDTFSKKDVDEAYLKGVRNTKNEIEKQYEANYQTRKDIATFIFNYSGDIKDRAKWMDYLGIKVSFVEKQAEKKPILDFKAKDWYVSKVDGKIHNIYHSVDKIGPKFKVGDWVVQGCNILKIRCVGDEYYCFETVGGYVDDMLVSEIDSLYHLWTIQDAKDGDVLVADSRPFIYNGSKNEVTVGAYCGFNVKNKFSFAYNYVINRNITPATKEQRNLLFEKMKEAGYTFDFEKNELKKIEQNLAENVKPQSSTPMSYGKELEKRMYEACNRFFAPNTDSNRYSASDLFYAGVKAERDLNTLAWSDTCLE